MTERKADHATFVIERSLKAPPARVFRAFADAEANSKWFRGPPGAEFVEREFDFRVGGRERVVVRHPGGTVTDFDASYRDIVPDQRIVYSFDMHLDGKKISVSLTTVELQPAGAGTRLVFTEQDVFLDGYDDVGSRERGSNWLVDALVASVEAK